MPDTSSPSLPPDDRFEAAVTEYLRQREQGQVPDAEHFLRSFPELADRLRQFFADQGLFDLRARDLAPTMSRLPDQPATGEKSLGSTAKDIPASVGRFLIREWLGEGAFGVVYRAVDPQLDREVALKVAKPASLTSSERVERFLREGKAAAQLRHPHIVPVFEAGRDGSSYYIASAYIKGRTLQETIFSGGIGEHRAVEVVRDIAEALAYAHTRGIVHRDVKPANILLDEQGQPLLTDFGLAARHELDEKLTQQGAILGTPLYMAPEQAAGSDGPALPASDQYSLGVVFYELLTGRTPFTGPAAVVLGNHGHLPPPEPGPAVPPELKKICLKTLAKVPGERFPDCEELARVLQRWLDTHPSGEQVPSSRPRLGRRPRLLLAGVCGVAAVCFAVWGFWPKKGEEKPVAAENPASGGPQRPATGRGEELPFQMRLRHSLPVLQPNRIGNVTLPCSIISTPDGKRVATLVSKASDTDDESGVIKVWDTWTGKELCSLETKKGPRGGGFSLYLSPDGKTVVSVGLTSTGKRTGNFEVQFWNVQDGKELRTVSLPNGVPFSPTLFLFSPDTRFLVRLAGKEVRGIEVASGAEKKFFELDMVYPFAGFEVFYQPSTVTECLAIVNGNTLHVWKEGQEKAHNLSFVRLLKRTPSSGLCLSSDGQTLASIDDSNDTSKAQIKLTSAIPGKTFPALEDGHIFSAPWPGIPLPPLAFSPDGKKLAAGDWSREKGGSVKVWDVTTGKCVTILSAHPVAVDGLRFSPDGKKLITAVTGPRPMLPGVREGWDGGCQIKLWDVATGHKLAEVAPPDSRLSGVYLSPDGSMVAALNVGEEGMVRGIITNTSPATVWDLVPSARAAPK